LGGGLPTQPSVLALIMKVLVGACVCPEGPLGGVVDVVKGFFGAFNALKGSFRATPTSGERPSRHRTPAPTRVRRPPAWVGRGPAHATICVRVDQEALVGVCVCPEGPLRGMVDVSKGPFGAFNALKGSFRATPTSGKRPSRRRDRPLNYGDRLCRASASPRGSATSLILVRRAGVSRGCPLRR
jgi:hypothetical protein